MLLRVRSRNELLMMCFVRTKKHKYGGFFGLQISHHTGAQLTVFPFHTIELMNKFRHPRPVHAMKRQVPVFQAKRYAMF